MVLCMKDKKEKDNILPLRKKDITCHLPQSGIGNALFLIGIASQSEEYEQEIVKSLLEIVKDVLESYQENDLLAEIAYRDIIKIEHIVDAFFSEATICPNCKSINILVEESDEEIHNKCLDCQNNFISDE